MSSYAKLKFPKVTLTLGTQYQHSSSNKDDDNYYSDMDDTDSDKKNNFNLIQERNSGRRAEDNTD